MTGVESLSNLAMTGGRASRGSRFSTVATRSRTSWAATSTLRFRSNVMSTSEMPCPETLRSSEMPSTVLIDFLETLADQHLDLFGRGAGQHRLDPHRRQVHRREPVHAQPEVRGRADHDQRQHDHAGEDRTADADVSE